MSDMMISNIIVILAGCIEKEFDIYSVKALSCFIAWFPFLDKSFTKLCTLQGFFQVVLQKCRVLRELTTRDTKGITMANQMWLLMLKLSKNAMMNLNVGLLP